MRRLIVVLVLAAVLTGASAAQTISRLMVS